MAVAIVQDFVGGSQDRYDAVFRELGLDRQPAEGLILHLAGPAEGGWRVIDVWESEEAFERFRRERLMPAIQAVGNIPRPQVQVTPGHNLVR